MNDEARKPPSDAVALRAYVEALLREMDLRYQQRYDAQIKAVEAAFAAADKAVQAAMAAAEKAVTKAEIAAEKRFDAVNEFRSAYQDIIAHQMPRTEADQRFEALGEKIDDLKARTQQMSGRSDGISAGWGYVVGGIAFIGMLVSILGAVLHFK